MSAKIMGKVWELELSPAKQTVLLALADHADHEGGNVFPTVALVAWKTGYSERQVQRVMKELKADGLLVKVDERPGKPTLYRIDLSKGVSKPVYVPKPKPARRGDKMSPLTPDKMSPLTPDKMSPPGVTSHGTDETQRGDIASANLSSNRHKDQPSVEQEQEKAVVVAAPEILFKPQNFVSSQEQEPLPETPRVYAVFVENMRQQVTPLIADALRDAVAEFSEAWVEAAIREAVLNNVPKWVYAAAILDRWQREGRVEPRPLARSSANGNEFDAPAESDGRRYVSGKYADFIEH